MRNRTTRSLTGSRGGRALGRSIVDYMQRHPASTCRHDGLLLQGKNDRLILMSWVDNLLTVGTTLEAAIRAQECAAKYLQDKQVLKIKDISRGWASARGYRHRVEVDLAMWPRTDPFVCLGQLLNDDGRATSHHPKADARFPWGGLRDSSVSSVPESTRIKGWFDHWTCGRPGRCLCVGREIVVRFMMLSCSGLSRWRCPILGGD